MTQRYTDMEAGDMLAAVADDAQKWAAAFHEHFPQVPEDVMIGWFANAIENSYDVRCSRLTRSDDAWASFREQVESNRKFWRELQAA